MEKNNYFDIGDNCLFKLNRMFDEVASMSAEERKTLAREKTSIILRTYVGNFPEEHSYEYAMYVFFGAAQIVCNNEPKYREHFEEIEDFFVWPDSKYQFDGFQEPVKKLKDHFLAQSDENSFNNLKILMKEMDNLDFYQEIYTYMAVMSYVGGTADEGAIERIRDLFHTMVVMA